MKPFLTFSLVLTLSFSLMGCDFLNMNSVSPDEELPADPVTNDAEMETRDSDKELIDDAEAETGFQYETYSEERFNELRGEQPLVLNFHADWCPNCRALDQLIKDNANRFPEDVVILKVDYDTYHGLKKAYGITVQTTLVFFNREGEQVAKKFKPSLEELQTLMASL